ncbi:MAG: hypothetical protein IKX36_03675 [Prevotella sp.]|nr:hypothetical protein [Prevotella sp.]
MSSGIFPFKADALTVPPQAPSCFISCYTVDDGSRVHEGGCHSVPLRCGISHSCAPDASDADLKYRVFVPPATTHTTLAGSTLRSTNEAARRLVPLHLRGGRSAWLAAQPVAHPSITLHCCHLACGTLCRRSLHSQTLAESDASILQSNSTKNFTAHCAYKKKARH